MRYIIPDDIKQWLKNYGFDFVNDLDDVQIENFIEMAENFVDSYTNRTFSLQKVNELQNGTGSYSLIVNKPPILKIEKIVCRYYPLTVVRTFKDGDGYIIVNRKLGKISIRPTFALIGAFPPDYAQYYAFIFPKGDSNINIEYYSGNYFVGDNQSFDKIGEYGFSDIMSMSDEGEYISFNLPWSIGKHKWIMYKGGSILDLIDDTDNWELVSSIKVRCLKENFDNTQWYRLVYIPSQVERATILISSSYILSHFGGRPDGQGGAGVQSLSVSGFSESYGDKGKYSGQINLWMGEAKLILDKYKKSLQMSLGR